MSRDPDEFVGGNFGRFALVVLDGVALSIYEELWQTQKQYIYIYIICQFDPICWVEDLAHIALEYAPDPSTAYDPDSFEEVWGILGVC